MVIKMKNDEENATFGNLEAGETFLAHGIVCMKIIDTSKTPATYYAVNLCSGRSFTVESGDAVTKINMECVEV